ncbi:uncharacterized protein [Drosophila tropicalis]
MRILWQCVWEADVYLVVQLTEDMSYIPLSSQQRLEFGQFQVYQEFSQTTVLIHCLEGGVNLTADLLLYTLDHNEVQEFKAKEGAKSPTIPSQSQYSNGYYGGFFGK